MCNEKKNALVSVIIPTYRRAEQLPLAIDSVLNQTYKNVQVVVVDDNNPDTEWRKKTETIMHKYAQNDHIKYIKHIQNSNGSVARNTGIKESDGEIICFLDDDDVYLPQKIEKQIDFLIKHPEYHAVYCGWDRNGVMIPQIEGDCTYELLTGNSLIYTNVIMMWKKDAILCGGWDETFKRHQEAAFMLRYFGKGGKIGLVKECLVKFDTSDRRNAAKNGRINEQQMDHYLSSYSHLIDVCEAKRKGSKKNIYSYRYRGVLLKYIKERNFKDSLRIWLKYSKKMPIKFNVDIIKYIFERTRVKNRWRMNR